MIHNPKFPLILFGNNFNILYKSVHPWFRFKPFILWHATELDMCRGKSTVAVMPEMITEENQHDVLEDIITPLVRTPYAKQLTMKRSIVRDCIKDLQKFANVAYNVDTLPVSPSPLTEHYRNKDEFSVRNGIDGEDKVFGFFTSRPDKRKTYAVRPTNLINIKKEHLEVLKVFEDFVKKSPLPSCYSLNDGGYWRRLLLRSNIKGDIMAIAVVYPRDRNPEDVVEEKQQLSQHFKDNGIQLHSLYHQTCKHVTCTAENSVLSLVHGEPCLYETLLDNEYRISPDSFFYINVKAAEVLLEEIFKLVEFSSTTTLLDLCCGVGTLSLSYGKTVRNCIGLDSSRISIEDALVNCKINEARNCEFTWGKIEERLTGILEYLDCVGDIIVIASPGRAGLHPRVVELLHKNPAINKIIYLSSNLDNQYAKSTLAYLMNKTKIKSSKRFKLSKVKPVDMFPHTFHYELIMVFER